MEHITVRVAWHDSKWNGCVCEKPAENCFCTALDRIREGKNDEAETSNAKKSFAELPQLELPPCKVESAVFMNEEPWFRTFEHPYANNKKAASTHGRLKPTEVNVPPFSTFAVPFATMLKKNQKMIDEHTVDILPPDAEPPFPSPWVFSRERQDALLDRFYKNVTPNGSLIFFYTKEGQPVDESLTRLVVGIGRVTAISPILRYKTKDEAYTYAMWDRLISHSIRHNSIDGFLLPYHEYLAPTGNNDEDERRKKLLAEIIVVPETAHIGTFSYACETASADVALSTLIKAQEAVRAIRKHGIVKGPWAQREEWLNGQIAIAWKDRGAFPGLGSVLEALGMRLGTSLVLEAIAKGALDAEADPWPYIDGVLGKRTPPPRKEYSDDIAAVSNTWVKLPEERRDLARLLSRFALSIAQAKRWYDGSLRNNSTEISTSDGELIENPYLIAERDLGAWDDSAISIGTIDRGLLPDDTLATRHPVPEPSRVGSLLDPRRCRAAFVEVLKAASENGDSLLGVDEALKKVASLDLEHPCELGSDWPAANREALSGAVEILELPSSKAGGQASAGIQLSALKLREERLRKVLESRAAKKNDLLKADWSKFLLEAIADSGKTVDHENPRHQVALDEQAAALAKIVERRLGVLVGRAGTGKTSIVGALLKCPELIAGGVLLLAPTGKARVKLASASSAEAMTIAQFLNRLGRYDGERQRPLFSGKEKYRKEKTIVIDECSMITMDYLYALLEALDLAHAERIILVGDPNQLPPIGVGRPFADLVGFIDNSTPGEGLDIHGALARLDVEVRTSQKVKNAYSDALRLASWFTREAQPADADKVLSDLEAGKSFNDLDIRYWQSPEELWNVLSECLVRYLPLSGMKDITGFDTSLGLDERGWVNFEDTSGAEHWQILSPVRMHLHGVHAINRWIQKMFRFPELEKALDAWGFSLGEETIVRKDKVIQVSNGWRSGWNGKASEKHYIANGEIGIGATVKSPFLNVCFSGRPDFSFGYGKSEFPTGGGGPLQLAYALTVHKAQGSEFKKVFVIIPKECRLLSRELFYTALTRSREQLVLLIEGNDPSIIYELSKPERSETARRNTNLFAAAVRNMDDELPYAENLIHRTLKGHMVRSKSELVIANLLYSLGITYDYERILEGKKEPGRLRPDFSFTDASGDLVIWEHLGMLDKADYRKAWDWKKSWYLANGFCEGENLFTSTEHPETGLDAKTLEATAKKIKGLI